jgi:hypothetical protein
VPSGSFDFQDLYQRSRLLHSGVRSALVSKVAIALRSPESSSVKSGYCTPEIYGDELQITTDSVFRLYNGFEFIKYSIKGKK